MTAGQLKALKKHLLKDKLLPVMSTKAQQVVGNVNTKSPEHELLRNWCE